jgi:hypothetical protein
MSQLCGATEYFTRWGSFSAHVREMKEGPSESSCRGRLQTAMGCFGRKAAVVNAMVKRRAQTRHVRIRETNANEPLTTHRNTTRMTSKPELPAISGKSTEVTYLLAVRCPVHRRRDSNLGFRTELENLVGPVKGKGPSGRTARLKSTDRPSRGGLLRSSGEPG